MPVTQVHQVGPTTRMASLMAAMVLLSVLHAGEPPTQTSTDLSTPRAALMAHWANRDAYAVLLPQLAKGLRAAEKQATAESGIKTLLTGDALRAQEAIERSEPDQVVHYDRNILDEHKMPDGSVMITVKITNISPLPAGVSLSADEAKTRAEGVRLKYQLISSPAGWRISQVYEYQDWRSASDDNLRWSPLYVDDGAVKLYQHLHVNAFSN
jgi:predicted outer membrane protein